MRVRFHHWHLEFRARLADGVVLAACLFRIADFHFNGRDKVLMKEERQAIFKQPGIWRIMEKEGPSGRLPVNMIAAPDFCMEAVRKACCCSKVGGNRL